MYLRILLMTVVLPNIAVTHSQQNISAECNQNVSLPCSGARDRKFYSISWVKDEQILIRKSDDQITKGKGKRKVEFGDQHSLLLSRVTPQDSATYTCDFGAIVGEQNFNFNVRLGVKECRSLPELTAGNTTVPRDEQEHQVPLMWSLLIYSCVAVGKVCLSLTSLWVLQRTATRQQKKKWCRTSAVRHRCEHSQQVLG